MIDVFASFKYLPVGWKPSYFSVCSLLAHQDMIPRTQHKTRDLYGSSMVVKPARHHFFEFNPESHRGPNPPWQRKSNSRNIASGESTPLIPRLVLCHWRDLPPTHLMPALHGVCKKMRSHHKAWIQRDIMFTCKHNNLVIYQLYSRFGLQLNRSEMAFMIQLNFSIWFRAQLIYRSVFSYCPVLQQCNPPPFESLCFSSCLFGPTSLSSSLLWLVSSHMPEPTTLTMSLVSSVVFSASSYLTLYHDYRYKLCKCVT